MRRLLAVAVLLCASVAVAAEPVAKVIVPENPIAGDLIVLDASGSQGDQFDWVLEGSSKPILPVEKNTKCVFTTGTGGTFKFLFLAVGVGEDGTAKLVKERVTLTVKGPEPDPGPGPAPGPGPEPGPSPVPDVIVHGRLYVTYVIPENPTPVQSFLRTSPELRQGLAKMDAAFKSYLETENDLDRLNLGDRVRELKTPCAFIQNKDGEILLSLQDPSGAGIVAAVQKLRGK